MNRINKVFAEAATLPQGNQNGMKIDLSGLLAHAQRALVEMIEPFDDAPEHIARQFEERIEESQPGHHAHGLKMLAVHLELLKKAFNEGDAKTVRQFFDLYVFD